MAKTIKQIADEIGVSKTAVRNQIENLGLRLSLRKNGNQFAIDEEQERLIKSAFSQKETQSENANLVCDKSATLRLLSDTLSTLQEQLKEKDKQIERLQTELEQAQRNVTLAQQLHAVTEQKRLEQKEEVPEKKNWFWGRRK